MRIDKRQISEAIKSQISSEAFNLVLCQQSLNCSCRTVIIYLANLIVDDFEEFSNFLLTDSISLEVLSLGRKLEDDLFFQRKLVPRISEDLFSSSFVILWQQIRSDSGISSTLKK